MTGNNTYIRSAVSRSEFDLMVKSSAEAFGVGENDFFYINTKSPGFKLSNTRLYIVDDNIVGGLNILKRYINIAGVPVPTGAIADVHIKRAHRKKGYGLDLLADAVEYMKKEGYLFSLLCSDKHSFYGAHGWRMIPVPQYMLDASTPLFPVPDRYTVRRTALNYSLELLREISAANKMKYSGCFTRNKAYADSLPKWVFIRNYICFTAFEDDRPVAVCFIRKDKKTKIMWIHECRNLAGHDEAPKNLLRAALAETRRRRLKTLAGDLPETHPLAVKIALLGGCRTITRDIMGKILDLNKLVEKLEHVFENDLRSHHHTIEDGRYGLNISGCGSIALEWQNRNLSIININKCKTLEIKEIDQSEFVMRLLGVSGFHGINYTELNPLFETLLAPRDFIFWGLDRF